MERGSTNVVGVVVLLLLGAVAVIWFLTAAEVPFHEEHSGRSEAPAEAPRAPAKPPQAQAPTLRGTSDDAPERGSPDGPVERAANAGTAQPTSGSTVPAPAKAARASADFVYVTGRVIDEKRKPVSGARVRVRGAAVLGEAGVSDAKGRFRAGIERPKDGNWLRSIVVARAEDGRVAVSPRPVTASSPAEIDVGTLVLKPSHALRVRVTGDAELPQPVVLDAFMGGMFGGARFARAEGERGAVTTIAGLPEGPCRVVAWARGYGRGAASTSLPRDDDAPLEIAVHKGRTVEVTVVLEADGAPVENATLDLWEDIHGPGWMGMARYAPQLDIPPTDAQGRTTIPDLHHESPLRVVVLHEALARVSGIATMWRPPQPRIKPDDTSIRIELPALRTVAFPITDKAGPIPQDGTKLTLRPRRGAVQTPLPAEARIENGAVVVEGLQKKMPIHAEALTGDGRVARLFALPDVTAGHETSFGSGVTVVVRLERPDGSPVVGQHVVIRNRGNNTLHDPVRTDDTGVARIAGLMRGRGAIVFLVSEGQAWGGQAVGNIDLSKGDVELDVVLPEPRRAILKVLLDGKPGIPSEYSVGMPTHMGRNTVVAEEHLETGELHFAYTPTKGLTEQPLYFNATGYVPPPGVLKLTRGEGDGPDHAEVRLVSAGSVTVRVALPKDKQAQVTAQRFDDATQSWKPIWSGMSRLDQEGNGTFKNLPAGRYRMVETMAGIASATFELRAKETVVASIDASKAARCKGRVEVPAGFNVGDVRVHVRGTVTVQPPGMRVPQGAMVRGGSFWVRLPGDREVTLEPSHPTLVPAPEGGTAVLATPQEGVVLRMVAGATATIRTVPAAPPLPFGHGRQPGFTTKFFVSADMSGKPVLETHAIRKDGVLQLGGYVPGTYSLWIDIPGFAPLILRDVKLGAGDADLGEHALPEGTTLRVRVLTKAGEKAPRMFVSATTGGPIPYVRFVRSTAGSDVVELPGLGPGRFTVTIGGGFGSTGGKGGPEVIEVDGTGTIEREFDAR